MDLFVRIGTFQRVTSEKIKKIDSRLRLCAKRLKRLPLLSPRHATSARPHFDPAVEKHIIPPSDWNRRRQFRVAEPRDVRHGALKPPLISPLCVLGLDEAEKPAKAKGFLSPSETDGFATLVVSR